MSIITHDRVKLTSGVLAAAKGILWGKNALQSITIGRHTPSNHQQAIGFLGIVDYTSGVITSDVTLDTILVEGCDKAGADLANKGCSVYRYGGKQTTIGTESYVMTSCALQFPAGQAATVNYGWITSGLASYLDIWADGDAGAPTPSAGDESEYCVVLGDDGSGLALVPTWKAAFVAKAATIPVITDLNGTAGTVADNGLPGGIQNLGMNSTINRDQVLDVRSTSPVQFVTTYPIECTMETECNVLPVESTVKCQGEADFNVATFKHALRQIVDLAVQSRGVAKHVTADNAKIAANGDIFAKAIGLRLNEESETVAVGRHLSFTANFTVADLLIPAPSLYVAP